MDLHAQQIQGFFDIPVDHLYAFPVFIQYLREVIKVDEESVIVSPDSGSVKMAHSFADRLNCGFAVIAKRRVNATTVESAHLVGDVDGRTCVIVDDLTSTAGTLCAAADLLKRKGAAKVYAVVSHSLLTDKARTNLLNSPIEQLITTNTVHRRQAESSVRCPASCRGNPPHSQRRIGFDPVPRSGTIIQENLLIQALS